MIGFCGREPRHDEHEWGEDDQYLCLGYRSSLDENIPPAPPPSPSTFPLPVSPARHTDPETSHEAWKALKPANQQALLLGVYYEHPEGLTAAEVGTITGLIDTRANYWHRATDLLQAGCLEQIFVGGNLVKRLGLAGVNQMVLRITDLGRRVHLGIEPMPKPPKRKPKPKAEAAP